MFPFLQNDRKGWEKDLDSFTLCRTQAGMSQRRKGEGEGSLTSEMGHSCLSVSSMGNIMTTR